MTTHGLGPPSCSSSPFQTYPNALSHVAFLVVFPSRVIWMKGRVSRGQGSGQVGSAMSMSPFCPCKKQLSPGSLLLD